jgi:SAM-dependent methyltransferase
LKQQLKHFAFRLMRPGLHDVNAKLDHLERLMLTHGTPSGSPGRPVPKFATWRGNLTTGKALGDDGKEIPALTAKYKDELGFWVRIVKQTAQQELGGPFEQVYGGWQHDRIKELGDFLGVGGLEGAATWAATRSAVEIGAGPYPSIACVKWNRSVAVDPIADGYVAEDLLPRNCHCGSLTYINAPGENVPLPSGFADIVVIENCLDHVDDPGAVLRECNRLLPKGGLLWLLVDLMDYSDHMHPNPFSEQKLRDLLRREGFEPVKDRVSDHKSHPHAYGEYRGLLKKV